VKKSYFREETIDIYNVIFISMVEADSQKLF
jgi:hypothetical protein